MIKKQNKTYLKLLVLAYELHLKALDAVLHLYFHCYP